MNMIKNKYNFPLKMGRRFKEYKALYNKIKDQMVPNLTLTAHPKILLHRGTLIHLKRFFKGLTLQ